MGAADLARNWLMESGIQNIEDNGSGLGGINSWYDLDNKEYPHVYPEATGYAITAYIYLNRLKKSDALLDKARLAAEWLINYDMENGAVKTKDSYSEQRVKNSLTYAFDNGMVICGLINLHKETREEKYLNAAEKIAEFVIGKMQKQDGSLYAVYDSQKDELIDSEEKWSTQSGSYHAKLAIGLLKLYDATKNEKYKESTEDLCKNAMAQQKGDGRFISYKDTGATHIHPHSYSAEGLIYSGVRLNRPEFIDSAERATKWVLDNLREDGGINAVYNNSRFEDCERTDTLAQTLRLGAILKTLNRMDEPYLKKMEKLKDRLLSFQYMKPGQKGGFLYAEQDGEKIMHINSWCTMFAMQALDFYYKALSGKKLETELLI